MGTVTVLTETAETAIHPPDGQGKVQALVCKQFELIERR